MSDRLRQAPSGPSHRFSLAGSILGVQSPAHFRRDYVGRRAGLYCDVEAGRRARQLAAHEYARLVLHAGGLRLPSWLSEGLAEVLSSIRISAKSTTLDGYLPGRWRSLNRPWIPLAELFSITADSPLRSNRDSTNLFYAQSWARARMLCFSAD